MPSATTIPASISLEMAELPGMSDQVFSMASVAFGWRLAGVWEALGLARDRQLIIAEGRSLSWAHSHPEAAPDFP
jgi:hypothetical protein